MKLWEKKYQILKEIEQFTVGEDFLLDQKLIKYDCIASTAHVKMLHKIGILNNEEAQQLIVELNHIIELEAKGEFKLLREHEDCHTAIENHLIENLGDPGRKIHTARSRNDQVLTALWLLYKDELLNCRACVDALVAATTTFVKRYGKITFPGYTHTVKAMPSSIALWANAFIDSMAENIKGIDYALELIDQSPLGTGAGYGIPLAIDRKYTADLLGFKRVQVNPIYAQNSRGKFEASILHALSQIMFDLNKIASDLIIFSMPEIGYVSLPKELCTGSSIMPHKKNPDVLELLRAKYHAVVSYEFQVKNISANHLSGYNRDLQLTKEPTMKGFETTTACLSIIKLVYEHLRVNKERCSQAMTEELFATEEVYKLVKKGVPFRKAYKSISNKY